MEDSNGKYVVLYMGWETTGRKWGNGTWVQNYAEWANPEEPGKMMGMTCAVKFNQGVSSAPESAIEILNTYGDSMSVSA